MVVRIRFSMHGHRHSKFFRLVATNGKQRRDGKPIETLGVYRQRIDPTTGENAKTVEWSVARIKYWLGVGAIPSESAVRLMTQVSKYYFILDEQLMLNVIRVEYFLLIPNITSGDQSERNVLS